MVMVKHIFIQDRESNNWYFAGYTEWTYRTEYPTMRSRGKKVRYQKNYVYPIPEKVSAFVKAHKIIEANTKEEAWQILNSK